MYEMIKNLGSDIALIKNDMQNDNKTFHDKFTVQNNRITAIESFVEDTKEVLTVQQETNEAVNNRLDYNEALIKSKQAVLTAIGIIDTSKDDYRKITRDFLGSIEMENNAILFLEINKFGKSEQKSTVLLTFPTLNLKLELYKLQ